MLFHIVLEYIYWVQCILSYMVFDSKVFDHKGKCDSILVLESQSWCDLHRLVSKWSEMFLERRVCDDTRLDYPIHSLFHLNTEKYVDFLIHEVVRIYDFLRD